ncbi:conserved membrane hypothetical protein [uncultured Eubacteriales bacterium]|uniref:Uncharacterized protein n=1 Tax=uncultured Eubacteriales bacterium TaxID=172733 RepID=A0A212KJM6_9FIRM|nr:conserved membrane hypothetical protein [uncultured Eubacteriales bacterium]
MFHLMLGLSALAASWVILFLPFWLGGILQAIVTIFCRRWYLILLPAILSVVCMVWSVLSLYETIGAMALAIYWGIYFLFLMILFTIIFSIKRFVLRWWMAKNL